MYIYYALVVSGLNLLFYLKVADNRLDVTLMVYYIEGDAELREMILKHWVGRGLNDPLGYFVKAMEDLSSLQQGYPQGPAGIRGAGGRSRKDVQRPTLGEVCGEWLEEWSERYLIAKAPQLLKSSSPTKYDNVVMD